MITLTINGEERNFEKETSIADILGDLDIRESAIAVALNMQVVPRSEHGRVVVHDGDRLEIIRPVQGG